MGDDKYLELERLYKDILDGIDVRNNLIKLKIELKSAASKRAFAYMLAGDYSALIDFLSDDDPKIRKNVATILGELEDDDLANVLYDAYLKEETLYVKEAYLRALSKLSYLNILPQLRDRRDELSGYMASDEELKHIREEISTLNSMIEKVEPKHHIFIDSRRRLDIILTTYPTYVKYLKDEIDEPCRLLKSGIRLNTDNIRAFFPLRTYNELLICIGCNSEVPLEPISAAREIAESDFLEILKDMHNEAGSFRYRVELRGIDDDRKERDFSKKFSKELDRLLLGEVVNDTSDYELEIRLVKNKDNNLLPFIKLMTIEDLRFSYRINSLPVSLQPYISAIMMKISGGYLKSDARVIDPFCGVGTLLVERSKVCDYETLYGVDIYGKAIDMARENTKKAGIIVNYINRDFTDFTHEHKFSEVITEMPYKSAKHKEGQIKEIYEMFFDRLKGLLRPESVIVMCTDEIGFVKDELLRNKEYKLLKDFVLSEKLKKHIVVISYLG